MVELTYEIDWDKVESIDDIKLIFKTVGFQVSKEFMDSDIKHLLKPIEPEDYAYSIPYGGKRGTA